MERTTMPWIVPARLLSRNRRKVCCYRTMIKGLFACIAALLVITALISPQYGDNYYQRRDENSEYDEQSADYSSSSYDSNGDSLPLHSDVIKSSRLTDVIIYNRVPKCASTSTRTLLDQVSKANKLRIHVSKVYAQESLNDTGQEEFTKYVINLKRPLLFIRHVFFVDFTKFGKYQPLYINMIRDPLDRLVSDYYYKRYHLQHMFPMEKARRDMSYNDCVQGNHSECLTDGPKGYFRIVPYFCGQDPRCLQPSEWAVNRAKANVEKYFLVVGLVDDVSKFLEVLEFYLPGYFRGSATMYKVGGSKWKNMAKTKKKDPLEKRTVDIMNKKLTYDYDFYEFIKNRFRKQYHELLGYKVVSL